MSTPNSQNEKDSPHPQAQAAEGTTPETTAGTAGGANPQPQTPPKQPESPLQKAADEIIKESGGVVPATPPPAPATPAPTPTPPPAPPVQPPEPPQPIQPPVQKPAPEIKFPESGESAPPPEKEEPPAPPPPKPEQRRAAIRTYESDVAGTVRSDKVSLAGIAIAERRKRPKAEAPEKPRSFVKTLLLSLGILLIFLGGGAIAVVFFYEGDMDLTPVPERESLIFANETVDFNTDGLRRNQLIGTIELLAERATGTIGSITEILPTTEDEEGNIKPLTAEEFITRLNTRAPSRLLRSIREEFMLGVHVFDDNQPFLILKTTFFDTTFAGMLEWEKSLASDIPFLVGEIKVVEAPMETTTATSTATSTPATNEEETATTTPEEPEEKGPIPVAFGDVVVDNRDARILVDGDGNEYLVYAFPDTNTLIITTNRRTLSEIFDRLTTARFTQ